MNDDRLADLLLRWEDLHEQGQEASVEEICRDCPELVERLRQRIHALKALDWMNRDEEPPPFVLESMMTEDAPTRILAGRYRLDKLVSEGGYGQVWKAFDLELERTVALKVPKPSRRFSPDEVERFVAEARKLAKLRHPGIVAVHDICRSGAAFFFVSDLIEGNDLASRLRQGPIPHEQVVRLVAEVARILAYAHGKGFIHLDIKPANILLDAHDNPLLCDFGIAQEQELLREPKPVQATLAYASPEQIRGQTIDIRSDLWSLGVVMYEMLTGRLPFDDPNPVILREQIFSREPPLRTEDTELNRICLKCLAKNPAERYATAQELANALTANRKTPQRAVKGRVLAIFVALAVVLLCVLVATTFWPRIQSTPGDEAIRPEDGELPASEALRRFEGHGKSVQCVAFSPDGKILASGSADATVRLWPVDDDREVVVLPQITDVTAMAFTKDGKTLACGCENGTVRLWDLKGVKPKEAIVLPGYAGPITCMSFSPNGQFLATGGKDGTMRLLDRNATKPSAAVIPKAGGAVLWTSFSPEGDKLLIGYGDESDKPGEFWLWELRKNEGKPQLALRQRAPLVDLRDLRSLLISPEGTLILAAAGTDVYVWRKEEGKESFRVMGSFARPATCVAMSPDERLALSSGPDGLSLWSTLDMKKKVRFVGNEGPVNCAVFSPSGRLAASGGVDGTVCLWRIEE